MGAATCITVWSVSPGFSPLERAPYSPRRVLSTSFQREWSWPRSCPRLSNTTVPRASVTVMRVWIWSFWKPQMLALGLSDGSAVIACAKLPVAMVPAFMSGAASWARL
ncbi:hypothetical protein FQZ97_951480 [compost metagenome]